MPQVADCVLEAATTDDDPLSVYGPGTALRVMFQRNGWCLHKSGLAKGPGHAFFNFRSSSFTAIRLAIEHAWSQTVQDCCVHRTGLHRMRTPCPLIHKRVVIGKPDWQQAILARHMTGAFMSGAEKLQWSQVETGLCPLCGGKDTKGHRLFSCPALSDIRAPYMALLHTVQADFPEWAHMFAATEHDKQGMLRLITSARQLPPLVQTSHSGRVTLFTDGSALHSNCPPARLTYWSVVCSSLDCDSPDLVAWARLPATTRALQFRVLVQGSTPGCQTIPRAELAAVAWCADWLRARPTLQATLYTDSAYVMHVWAILSGRCPLRPLAGDLDLTASLALLSNTGRLDIRKVKAHNSAGLACDASPLLRFASEGNVAADAAARQARTQECELVRQVAEDIFEHYQYQLDHAELFAGYLVELNVAEQRRKEAAAGRHDITPVYDEARPGGTSLPGLQFLSQGTPFDSTAVSATGFGACLLVMNSCAVFTGGLGCSTGPTYRCTLRMLDRSLSLSSAYISVWQQEPCRLSHSTGANNAGSFRCTPRQVVYSMLMSGSW